MKEINCLHDQYNQIDARVGERTNLCISGVNNTYVNQCSLTNLVALQINMRSELERLLMDMKSEPAPTSNMVKLKAHTLQLRQLNQRAQTRLLLSNTPAN